MPVLSIGDSKVTVGDDFLALPPDQQQATVEEIAKSLPVKAAPVGATDVVRSAATGVPVVGGVLNKMNAATNAALAPVIEPFLSKGPDTLDQPTFGERYSKSLELQNARDAKFAAEHPVVDTAAKLTGGVAATVPLVMAAPAAFGIGGTLPSMVARGAASGAGLGAADAATRGEDVIHGAAVGGTLGAGGPLIARGVGKAIQAFTPKAPLVPVHEVDVAGVKVPMRPDQITGDIPAAGNAEMTLRGGQGERAQGVAQSFDDLQNARIKEAADKIGAELDPSSTVLKTPPQAAGERVASELVDREAQRLGTEQSAMARTAAEGERLRAMPSTQLDAQGAPVRTVDSPYAAAEQIGTGVQNAAQAARTARTEAYRDYAAVPGEYEPAAFTQIGNSIRQRLSAGDNPVRVTENLTPRAHEALNILDENVGTLRFQNDAQTGAQLLDASGRPMPRPITGQTIEEARKELTTLYGDARRAAMGPGGSQADVRAMDRIIGAFDNHVGDAARAGAFSGDAAALQAAGERARASHASYRRLFTNQGPDDEVGKSVEKIIGRYEGQAATPDQIAQLSYGSAAEPGGSQAIKVAQRLRNIFGEQSPEWGTYKQGLISHVVDTPPGTAARTPSQVADRIDKFLDGTKGRGLSQATLTVDERAALRSHADSLRTTEPVPLSSLNSVDKVIARISGRDGGRPMTPGEVTDLLFSRNGAGTKNDSVLLAQRLRRDLSPEGMTAVRQGMWEKLTNAGEGKIAFGPQALAQRLHEFLNESGSGLAKTLFSAAERQQMAVLAKTYAQMVPPKGTTNPSGTAPMLARMANKASSNLLAMLGAAHSGFPGMAAGYAAQKAVAKYAGAKNARAAEKLFYGEQPRGAVSSSRVPIVLSQGVAPTVANQ